MKTKKMLSKVICAILVMIMIATSAPLMGFATDSTSAPKINYISNIDGGVRFTVDTKITKDDENYYDVYRKTEGTEYEKIGTFETGNSYIDYTADHLETYTYDVAFNGGELSGEPQTIEYISTPRNSVILAGNGIKVSIQPLEGVEYYDVKRCEGSSGVYKNIARISASDAPYFYDETIEDQKIYTYMVRAVHNGYMSYYETNIVKTVFSSPTALANVNSGVKVSYQKVENAVEYGLYRRVEGEQEWQLLYTFAPRSYYYVVDYDVESGVIYNYTVSATTSDGTTNYDINGKKIMYLEDPAVFTTATEDGVVVDFTSTPGATYYQILRKPLADSSYKGIGIVYASEGVLSYTDKTAVEGESYTYAVRVYNRDYETPYNSYFQSSNIDYVIFSEDVTVDDDVAIDVQTPTDDTAATTDTTTADDAAIAVPSIDLSQIFSFISNILEKFNIDTSFLDQILTVVDKVLGFVTDIMALVG